MISTLRRMPKRPRAGLAPKCQRPILPAKAHSLARFVKAPAALAARLALIGVVEAKDGASVAEATAAGRAAGVASKAISGAGTASCAAPTRRSPPPRSSNTRTASQPRAPNSHGRRTARPRQGGMGERQGRAPEARSKGARTPRRGAEARPPRKPIPHAKPSASTAERARLAERRADLAAQLAALDAEIAEARTAAAQAEQSAAVAPASTDGPALAQARQAAEAARTSAAEAAAARAKPRA